MTTTLQEAREWVLFQWTADDGGTDLDWDMLVESFHAVFGRFPDENEDAFAILKNHIRPTVTTAEAEQFEINL
jgi:hypothetical protein